MGKIFDFNKTKRSYMTVKLRDGKTLVVRMPEKRVFERMQDMSELDDENNGDAYRYLLELVAEILSNNKNKEMVTAQYLEEEGYDIEELTAFLEEYGEFTNQLKNDPN